MLGDNTDLELGRLIDAARIDIDQIADHDGLNFQPVEVLDSEGDHMAISMSKALLAGRIRDAVDAARYRWLRSRDLGTINAGGVFAGKTPDNVVLSGEDLDAAIDAARLEWQP